MGVFTMRVRASVNPGPMAPCAHVTSSAVGYGTAVVQFSPTGEPGGGCHAPPMNSTRIGTACAVVPPLFVTTTWNVAVDPPGSVPLFAEVIWIVRSAGSSTPRASADSNNIAPIPIAPIMPAS